MGLKLLLLAGPLLLALRSHDSPVVEFQAGLSPPANQATQTEKLGKPPVEPMVCLVCYTNYGIGATGSAAGALVTPYQISKNAPLVIQSTQKIAQTFQHFAQGRKLLAPGAQVGLNLISGVAAFLPGKAQWIAAGAGMAGLGLEMAHQLGGLGK